MDDGIGRSFAQYLALPGINDVILTPKDTHRRHTQLVQPGPKVRKAQIVDTGGKGLHGGAGEILLEHLVPRLPVAGQHRRSQAHSQAENPGETIEQPGNGPLTRQLQEKAQSRSHDGRAHNGDLRHPRRVRQRETQGD